MSSLDDRLVAALAAVGMVPDSIQPIASRPPGVRPGAYVATTGTVRLKLRITKNSWRAERSAAWVRMLADDRMPGPLAVCGRVMVDGWVDGTPLDELRLDAALVDTAADLLADIHAFRGAGLPRDQSVAPIIRRMERQLSELVENGVLPLKSASALARIAEGLPDKARWGLGHGDFCGENLLLDPAGRVVSIDNAHACGAFLEYDLGRCWYRWSAPDWIQERLERRYDERTGAATDASERLAWRAAATTKGLHLRYRNRWPLDLPRVSVERLVA